MSIIVLTDPVLNRPSRYVDLTESLPRGTFWASEGHLLPLRDSAYDLLFQTDAPNTKFGVFINGEFRGVIVSESDGDVVITEVLSPGQAEELDRVCQAYPWLIDDGFVEKNLNRWLA